MNVRLDGWEAVDAFHLLVFRRPTSSTASLSTANLVADFRKTGSPKNDVAPTEGESQFAKLATDVIEFVLPS